MLRVLLIMLGALLAASVDGAVVVLKNGDRVSGVIISRVDGVIQVESAILGTLRIPGNQVDRIEEEVPGEAVAAGDEVPVIQKQGENVGPASEEIAEAAVATGVEETKLAAAVEAEKTETLLVEYMGRVPALGWMLEALQESAWVRYWDSSLTAGFNLKTGRADSRSYNFMFWSERRGKRGEARVEASHEFEQTIDSVGTRTIARDRARGLLRLRQNLNERSFLQSNSQYSNAYALGIDHDFRQSLGVGWRFANTQRLQISLTPALTAQYQEVRGATDGVFLAPSIFQELVYSLNERVTLREEINALFPVQNSQDPTYGFLVRMETKLAASLSFNIEYDYDFDGAAAETGEGGQNSIMARLGVAF